MAKGRNVQALGCKRSERLVPKIAKVQWNVSGSGVTDSSHVMGISLTLGHKHSFSDRDSHRDSAVRIIRIAICFATSGSQ